MERAKPRGLNKSKVEGYYEKHHIIPKCLGGSDRHNNLILLTGREHFIAHMLLWKAYPENVSLMRAAFMMSSRTKDSNTHSKLEGRVSSKTYEKLRVKYSAAVSAQCAGEGNPMFGRTHPPEVMAKIRATLEDMGRWKPKQPKIEKAPKVKVVKPPKPTFYERLGKSISSRSLLWASADILLEFWKLSGQVGDKFFDNLLVYKIGNQLKSSKTLVSKFQSGWIPDLDQEWLHLKQDVKFKDFRDYLTESLKESITSERKSFKDFWIKNRSLLRHKITESLAVHTLVFTEVMGRSTSVIDRIEMRILNETNCISQIEIAKVFGVKRNSVSSICSDKFQENFKYFEARDALLVIRPEIQKSFPELFVRKPLLDIRNLVCVGDST